MHGGNEDLEAVSFLQELNTTVHRLEPGVLTIAEESTAWDGVSRPVHAGGLGFTHKWNMGWMHDTLDYWSTDPYYRAWHHNQLTFGLTYGRPSSSCCRSATTRWCTSRSRCSGRCRGATTTSGSPTSARCTRGCGRTRGSSSSSWAPSWPTA